MTSPQETVKVTPQFYDRLSAYFEKQSALGTEGAYDPTLTQNVGRQYPVSWLTLPQAGTSQRVSVLRDSAGVVTWFGLEVAGQVYRISPDRPYSLDDQRVIDNFLTSVGL